VEIVRQALEAFRRRDNEATLQLYHSEIEIYGRFDSSLAYRGVDGVRSFFRDQLDVMERQWEPEEWIDAGDQVVAVLRVSGRGKKSGASFDSHESAVCTIRDGKLWRVRVYATKAEALKAVGLD
jgi:ketosteroid isomerase-like protein